MSDSKPVSEAKTAVWQTTRVPNLLRHGSSGRYYARIQVSGKRKLLSLHTALISVARRKLVKVLERADIDRMRGDSGDVGTVTMGTLSDLYRKHFQSDSGLSAATKDSREDALLRLEKFWGGWKDLKPGRITLDLIRDFANQLHTGALHAPPKAKQRRKGYSAGTVNRTLDTLNRLLCLAQNLGAIYTNPFAQQSELTGRLKKPVVPRKVSLPSRDQINKLFAELERVPEMKSQFGGLRTILERDARDVGQFVRFLAFSGARLAEANAVTWDHIKEKTLVIPGTKSLSSREREIPQIPAMRELLEQIRERRQKDGRALTGKLLAVSEAQKSINRACHELRIPRLTHHDFRHYFATVCIESGVDIPTVSRWLGHADGGALAMRTYGHLRQEHSIAQAARV